MDINISMLYEILREVVRQGNIDENKGLITYGDVSKEYEILTGVNHSPHGTWDVPLGQINNICNNHGLPPISAVVVLSDTHVPGNGFWGCAPNVPNKPLDENEALSTWLDIWKREVLSADWPETLI